MNSQLPLWDKLIDRVPSGKRQTSVDAFDATPRFKHQARIYMFILKNNGATCDEAELELGLLHQTCSARLNDLHRAGLIRITTEKRVTRTGRKAFVYTTVAAT